MKIASKLSPIFVALMVLFISGCKPERPDIGNVVSLGTVEEHVQYQEYPIYNCQSEVANTVVASRSRTLEQSVTVDVNVKFGKEQLSIIPYVHEIMNEIGVERGVRNTVSITDGGDLQMNAAPGTFPIYKIAWRETWENGYVVVKFLGDEKQVPYRYMQFARPEISNIQYIDCNSHGFATATALARVPTPIPTSTSHPPSPSSNSGNEGSSWPPSWWPWKEKSPSLPIVFKDDFSDTNGGWPEKSEPGVSTIEYEDGGYRILVEKIGLTQTISLGEDFADVRIEVDAKKLGGPNDNQFGVHCRHNGNKGDTQSYFFWITSDGYAVIGLHSKGDWHYLSSENMIYSDAINQGEKNNHIRADCIGNKLTLYVNGQKIAEITDKTLSRGDVALDAGAFRKGGVDIFFDNLIIYQP